MHRTIFALVCCLVLLTQVVSVQNAPDALTGNWGRNGRVYLELKFDGESNVSGIAIWRADEYEHRAPVKTGTFDPKSGVFKLEGDAKTPEGSTVPYVIEGKVEKDTVSGTFKYGERSGQFTFTRM